MQPVVAARFTRSADRTGPLRGEHDMPLFMDVHNLDGGVSMDDVCQAHAADLQTQPEFGVHYLRYWVDEGEGKIFCLVDAPDAETANEVHRKAHGLVADEIFQVQEGT
jgi:hypothetical protein